MKAYRNEISEEGSAFLAKLQVQCQSGCSGELRFDFSRFGCFSGLKFDSVVSCMQVDNNMDRCWSVCAA